MKRKDAIRKVCTVCQRLDEVDPETFFVIPLRMYLLGSVLTDKPKPEDIDMLFEYQEPRDRDEDDLVYRLFYGKPLPYEQAFQHLRRGMKMIRTERISMLDIAGLSPDLSGISLQLPRSVGPSIAGYLLDVGQFALSFYAAALLQAIYLVAYGRVFRDYEPGPGRPEQAEQAKQAGDEPGTEPVREREHQHVAQ